MGRRSIALVLTLVGCGPSLGNPMAESNGDTSSGASAAADASTGASAGSDATATDPTATTGTADGPESSAGVEATSAGTSTTGSPSEELPPDAAGNWLCTGFEDPIYLSIAIDDAMQWAGTACGPNLGVRDPSEWTNCDVLTDHFNPVGTQAYWAFVLPYEDFGGPPILFEIALDYVAQTDTLEGLFYAETVPGFVPATCKRY